MKPIKLLFCFFLFIFSFSICNGQSWVWAKQGYDSGSTITNELACPIAVDKNGNAYITGNYQTTVVFGNDTLKGGLSNAYLVKYDSKGSAIWSKQVQSYDSLGSFGLSVAVDKSDNVYMTGTFGGNSQVGTFSLSSTGINNYNIFLIKYNTNGNVLWAKQSKLPSANSYGFVSSVATDKFGNIFITGYFQDTISFGPFSLTSRDSSTNIFLVKYDSSGTVLWAKQSNNPSTYPILFDNSFSVATDNSGDAYITGLFDDTLNFGATQLINNNKYPYSGYFSSFLVKYSSTGSLIWAKQTVNGNINSFGYIFSILSDGANGLYLAGCFYGTLYLGSHVLYSPLGYSAFLTKCDTNGNTIWAKQSSPGWEFSGIASDAYNRLYIVALSVDNSNPDSLRFGNYLTYTNLSATNASVLIEFDASGNPLCGSLLNNLGSQYNAGNGIACDSTGNYIYMTSVLENIVYCGTDTLLDIGGGMNPFIARWLPCKDTLLGIPQLKYLAQNISLYPNPNNGVFTLRASGYQSAGADYIEVYNMLGARVYNAMLKPVQHDYQIDLSGQPAGVYLYRVVSETGGLVGDGKFVIQK